MSPLVSPSPVDRNDVKFVSVYDVTLTYGLMFAL